MKRRKPTNYEIEHEAIDTHWYNGKPCEIPSDLKKKYKHMKTRKPIMIFLGAVMLIGVSQNVTAQQSVVLTLEESIRYALENNVDAKNAQLEILVSKGVIGENRAQGLPQITANLELTKNLQPPLLILPAEAGAAFGGGGGDGVGDNVPPPSNTPDDLLIIPFAVNYQSNLAISVEQMIFNGSYFVGLKAAKTLKALTEYDKEKTENDVIESVKKAYYTVLVNEERRGLVSTNLKRIETLLNETQELFDAGFVEKLDVSRVRVQKNNLTSELERVEAAVDISKELLKLQIGMPVNMDIVIEDKLANLKQTTEIEELINNPGTRRVELDQLKKNHELLTLDMKNNQVQYIPNISAFGTYQRVMGAQQFNTILDANRWFPTSFVGLRMSIPIFDGLRKSYLIQQNRVQLRQIENQQLFLQENIEVERFQAKTTLRNSLRTLAVQEENMELAREVFDMTKIKYQEGVGSNLEVVDADSALKEAESNYFSALYDALIAKVDLEKALGIL